MCWWALSRICFHGKDILSQKTQEGLTIKTWVEVIEHLQVIPESYKVIGALCITGVMNTIYLVELGLVCALITMGHHRTHRRK